VSQRRIAGCRCRYASLAGTAVIQQKVIPPPPRALAGWLSLFMPSATARDQLFMSDSQLRAFLAQVERGTA
jgi:hypothetical protein